MIRIYELCPTAEQNQKSFYGKAKVVYNPDNGTEMLYSYDTLILIREAVSGVYYRVWEGWSATTQRHIKAFCGMNKAEFNRLPMYKLEVSSKKY